MEFLFYFSLLRHEPESIFYLFFFLSDKPENPLSGSVNRRNKVHALMGQLFITRSREGWEILTCGFKKNSIPTLTMLKDCYPPFPSHPIGIVMVTWMHFKLTSLYFSEIPDP